MSPTIFRHGPYRFYFFSREEVRIHVQSAAGEAKFWLDPKIELAQNHGLNQRQIRPLYGWSKSMKTKSAKPGKSISAVEVANVTRHGFWLMLGSTEFFLPFDQFPWFRDASIRQLTNVELPSPHHLYWPELDIDLAVDSISHPDRYPLISSAGRKQ